MRFVSDNAAAAHPKVIEAIAASNVPDTAYDGDQWSKRLDGAFSQLFETEVRALWVSTGTAANCLALAAQCPPYRAILCHREAHIETDEAGAPGFFTGGAKLILLDGPGAKISPEAVNAGCDRIWKDVHQVQPAAISITNATEYGRVYRAGEVAALGDVARSRATTGDRLADLTWRAGVGTLSFGFIKNGGLNAECLILFKTELAEEIEVRRKRAGHLSSKGRMLAAQILAMLENDLWLENARSANAAARVLARAAPQRLLHPVEANEVFLQVTAEESEALHGQGFQFYDWRAGEIRLVTSWDTDEKSVEKLASALAAL
jgi:threonine aldolase